MVLLLEDLYWIDCVSDVIFVMIVVFQVLGFFVLLMFRLNSMLVWIACCCVEIVVMQLFDDDFGLVMLVDMFGFLMVNDDLKNWIILYMVNIFFFIEEVCCGLCDSGMFYGQWGDLVLVCFIEEFGIFLSIQGVIVVWFDWVLWLECLVFQVVVVFGLRLCVVVFCVFLDLFEQGLQNCFVVFDCVELLVRVDSELDDVLEFWYEMVCQVIYDLMVVKVCEGIYVCIFVKFECDGLGMDEFDILCYYVVCVQDWLRVFIYGWSVG